jgi:hypothetical protein
MSRYRRHTKKEREKERKIIHSPPGKEERKKAGIQKDTCFSPYVAMQLAQAQLEYAVKRELKFSSGSQTITGCENVPGT